MGDFWGWLVNWCECFEKLKLWKYYDNNKMSHFYNAFILSCGTSWYGNLLFYFDLYATDTLVIVKNIVTTPKCHNNIFTKALFSIVVSLSLIVYYILFWLVRNWYLSNCKNIMTIYWVGITTLKIKIIHHHV